MPLTAFFGGTFDPVHNGHLAVAGEAVARFGLDRVLFVPAANPPHKLRGAAAPYDDRVRMLQLACAGHPRFEVSRIEAGTARSYSIDTIERLRAAGVDSLAFLIGADAFADIRTWHRWRDVIAAVEFLVVTRPGAEYQIPEGVRLRPLEGVELPISSSEIRAQIARGDFNVPVPEPVIRYIREHGLYQSRTL
jgi:nicotinate-nucleotide adenylyltransferase